VLSSTDLSRERQDEVLRALDIDRIPVHEIMVPRDEVVALHDTNDLYENLHRMRTHPHDRYPLLGNGWDDVRGTLYLPTVFRHLPELDRGAATLGDIAEPVVWAGPDLPVSELIDRLQREKQELARVRNDGAVLGLVTATDAFEAIAGEMEDPMDVAQSLN